MLLIEEEAVGRAIALSTLLFLREAASKVVSASEAENFARDLLGLSCRGIDALKWRGSVCLSSIALAEEDLDAARAWNDQAVSGWKNSGESREAFVRDVIEGNGSNKPKRKGVSLGMEKDPKTLGKLRNWSLVIVITEAEMSDTRCSEI